MPNCPNCDSWVSKQYVRVKSHEDFGGTIASCGNCVAQARAGGPIEDLSENAVTDPDRLAANRANARQNARERKDDSGA